MGSTKKGKKAEVKNNKLKKTEMLQKLKYTTKAARL